MITKEEALRIADDHLNRGRFGPFTGDEERIVDDQWTVERDYGWLFTYNRAEYIRTRNPHHSLVGNGPVLVRSEDGAVIVFSSAFSPEKALAEYEAHPEKHPPVGHAPGESAGRPRAREGVADVQTSATRRRVGAGTLQKALAHINPTGSDLNCVECAMAVDDVLHGRPAVAGPTPDQPGRNVVAALSPRSTAYLEELTATDIERLLLDTGSGARGIVIGWKNGSRGHAFNVANVDGVVYWLDGQKNRMAEHDPYGYKTLDLYRTGEVGER